MLSRLRISQRLGLLLIVPIGAMVIIGVPAVVDRIDQSRASAAVVGSVTDARIVADLIHELQQERLLSLAFLASPATHRSALVSQHASTVGSLAQARAAVAGPHVDELRGRMAAVADLATHRAAVLARQASPEELVSAYHERIAGLIDALHLVEQPDVDATGARQAQALDALLRANEQSSQAGASLVLAAVDAGLAARLAHRAQLLGATLQDRFAELAGPTLAALLGQAVAGPSDGRVDRLLTDLAAQRSLSMTPDDGLSLAQHDADLRRLVQEHVERVIVDGASERATGARHGAVVMAAVTAGVTLAVLLLGIAVTRSVSRPLRRITVAATAIAELARREMVRTSRADETDDTPPRLAAITLRSADEIGELASAFNRVQATAALLMEQQVATRRNVATMFGNIAHRTQSLVSRQLIQIDELERNERDEHRLASLYRLDHLTARLRRSADSLLVIAGTRDDTRLAVPLPLADVIRSAMAEVEGYQGIALGRVDQLMLTAAVVPDLTLLLAELLENATSFSPPGVLVEVSAVCTPNGDCVVRIVDHGIGMTPQRLDEENQRLVAAERVDVTPTSVLGLFVVGRLARRHGIGVRLLPTPVSGITAEVSIPANLQLAEPPDALDEPPLRAAIGPGPAEPTRGTRPLLGQPSAPPPMDPGYGAAPWIADPQPADPPARFAPWSPPSPAPTGAVNGGTPAVPEPSRGGLRRRQPGRSLQAAGGPPAGPRPAQPSVTDPGAEKAALDAFAEGTARAEAQADQTGRHGLRRRQPGAHLAAEVRRAPGLHRRPEEHPFPAVDPEAERDQINGYLDGIARAEQPGRFRIDPWSG